MRNNRRAAFAAVTVTAVTAALALTACGSSDPSDQPIAQVSASATTAAVVLDQPFAKPALTLTDTDGKPYDLVKQTAGKPTLLYFGYTHCPDVCPTTMADIAAAKRKLPKAEQDRLQVVFVSTDPDRDTPQRLRQWLAVQDPGFVGLTGDITEIQKAARSLGVMIEKPVKQQDGSITVSHGAEVFAYSPKDNNCHFLYTSGVSADQYATDLPKLITGRTP
jgi:protein SCO1/2